MDSIDDVTASMARRSLGRGISLSVALHILILIAAVFLRPVQLLQVPPPTTLIELVKEEPAEPVPTPEQQHGVRS